MAGSLNPKDINPQEFKEALSRCKTEQEIDSLCQREVKVLFLSPQTSELMKAVYAARYVIITKRIAA